MHRTKFLNHMKVELNMSDTEARFLWSTRGDGGRSEDDGAWTGDGRGGGGDDTQKGEVNKGRKGDQNN